MCLKAIYRVDNTAGLAHLGIPEIKRAADPKIGVRISEAIFHLRSV